MAGKKTSATSKPTKKAAAKAAPWTDDPAKMASAKAPSVKGKAKSQPSQPASGGQPLPPETLGEAVAQEQAKLGQGDPAERQPKYQSPEDPMNKYRRNPVFTFMLQGIMVSMGRQASIDAYYPGDERADQMIEAAKKWADKVG